MEKLNFKLFKLRLNGSDHLFVSHFPMAAVGEERTVDATDGH